MTLPRQLFLIAGWLVVLMGALQAQPSNAASFPCGKARTTVEKLICGSPEVSVLDDYQGRYFSAARAHLKHADRCLVDDQKAWLRALRDPCRDAACLTRVYLDRLAVLHCVQSGVTSLRHIELPKSPSLVWIVPPAADQVAAPRHTLTVPLSATGQIVNEVAHGDGYVLQTRGETLLLVPLMFLAPPTVDALDSLARDPNANYAVRGFTDTRNVVPRSFAAGECTFVYRAH